MTSDRSRAEHSKLSEEQLRRLERIADDSRYLLGGGSASRLQAKQRELQILRDQNQSLSTRLERAEQDVGTSHTEIAELKATARWKLGDALVGAALGGLRDRIALPKRLFKVWRRGPSSAPRVQQAAPSGRGASGGQAPVERGATFSATERRMALSPSSLERPRIAGVLTAQTAARWGCAAVVKSIDPTLSRFAFDAGEADLLAIESGVALAGSPWFGVGTPLGAERERQLVMLVDEARRLQIPVVFVQTSPSRLAPGLKRFAIAADATFLARPFDDPLADGALLPPSVPLRVFHPDSNPLGDRRVIVLGAATPSQRGGSQPSPTIAKLLSSVADHSAETIDFRMSATARAGSCQRARVVIGEAEPTSGTLDERLLEAAACGAQVVVFGNLGDRSGDLSSLEPHLRSASSLKAGQALLEELLEGNEPQGPPWRVLRWLYDHRSASAEVLSLLSAVNADSIEAPPRRTGALFLAEDERSLQQAVASISAQSHRRQVGETLLALGQDVNEARARELFAKLDEPGATASPLFEKIRPGEAPVVAAERLVTGSRMEHIWLPLEDSPGDPLDSLAQLSIGAEASQADAVMLCQAPAFRPCEGAPSSSSLLLSVDRARRWGLPTNSDLSRLQSDQWPAEARWFEVGPARTGEDSP